MKTVQPSPLMKQLREELIAVVRNYSDNMTGEEILAILAYTVGQTIAMQDQNTMTPDRALKIVEVNIEQGNQYAIDHFLKSPPAGSA